MQHSRLTDEGLKHIGRVSTIAILDLRGNRITDEGIMQLTKIANLERIYLGETRVTIDGMKRLQDALPNCQVNY
jgi:hypothetical protein